MPPAPASEVAPETAVPPAGRRPAPIRTHPETGDPGTDRPADAPAPVVNRGGEPVWRCPRCATESPIDTESCPVCSFSFRRLVASATTAATGPASPPGRAAFLSLLLPGLGHVALGRVAEGVARAVVFAYAVGTAVAVLWGRGSSGAGPFVPLALVALGFAAALYAVTAVDAARAARGDPPVLGNRALLYGATGLMMLTVVVLVVTGFRVSAGGG